MLAFSAAFAFFVIVGLGLVGLTVFVFFWGRAKLFGNPFGPHAQFEAMRRDMESQFGPIDPSQAGAMTEDGGPIIDAHETPQGWSVDD